MKRSFCHGCGSTQAYADVADEVFLIEGERVLVERISVMRCARCGEHRQSRDDRAGAPPGAR